MVSRARRSWHHDEGETPDWALPSRTRRREREHEEVEVEAVLELRGIWRGWSSGGAPLRRAAMASLRLHCEQEEKEANGEEERG
jgi:hypothetical protein